MADKNDMSNGDAVNLCSQHAYPGDEELEDLETEIWVKWKLDQLPEPIDPATLPTRLSNGESSQREVITMSGEMSRAALMAVPTLSNGESSQEVATMSGEMSRASLVVSRPNNGVIHSEIKECIISGEVLNTDVWVQRATGLVATGELKEALRCCSAIQPAKRTADVWKMGGLILDKLGLPVTAENWLRYATRLAPPGDRSAATMFQKVRVRRLYQPLTRDMAVEVTFTSQGRAICATKAVKKGEVVFSDKPILLAQSLPSLKFPCCANCVKSLIAPQDVFTEEELQRNALSKAVKKYWPVRERVACTCGHEVYCSKRCQQEAWESSHRLICTEENPAMRQLYEVCGAKYESLTSQDCSAFDGWWAASFSPVLLAKLWAQIVCSAVRLATDMGRAKPSAHDWALARAPYRR